MRRLLFLLGAALLATACAGGGTNPLAQQGSGSNSGGETSQGTVVIGSADFYEQRVLGNMYAELLADRGVDVRTRLNLGKREVVIPALKSGDISVTPEYTGNLLAHLSDEQTKVSKPGKVLDRLRQELPQNIVALEPATAQDKDALVVTRETAQQYDLQTVSDLKGVAGKLTVGGPPELKTRSVGLPGYKRVYGLEFKNFRSLDAGGPLTKSALKKGDIDVARLFTTDPSIPKNDWVTLKDDKNLIPAQNLIPVIRKDALTPEIRKALNELSAQLTTQVMFELNSKVVLDKADPEKVARQWLQERQLISSS